jgi:steroid delta-isomerase-like uncharacterized protein
MRRLLIRLLFAGIAIAVTISGIPKLTGPLPSLQGAAAADIEANKELVRNYFEIASDGDLEDLTEVVAPDLVIHTAPLGGAASLESLKETLRMARAGLPDFAFQIEDLFTQDDLVVVRTKITGTHLGEFFGAPPTGNEIQTTAIDLWRVRDGKLAEVWHLEDILGVMEQVASSGSTAVATETSEPTRSVTAPPTNGANASAAEYVAMVERFRGEIFGQRNLTVAETILHSDVIWHGEGVKGIEGVRRQAAELQSAFPDLSVAIELTVAEGDRVAVLWEMTGTHLGKYLGIPPSAASVSTPGIDIYRIEDGKIAEIWTVGDDLGLLMQIGGLAEFEDDA